MLVDRIVGFLVRLQRWGGSIDATIRDVAPLRMTKSPLTKSPSSTLFFDVDMRRNDFKKGEIGRKPQNFHEGVEREKILQLFSHKEDRCVQGMN